MALEKRQRRGLLLLLLQLTKFSSTGLELVKLRGYSTCENRNGQNLYSTSTNAFCAMRTSIFAKAVLWMVSGLNCV